VQCAVLLKSAVRTPGLISHEKETSLAYTPREGECNKDRFILCRRVLTRSSTGVLFIVIFICLFISLVKVNLLLFWC
jgi:hypothetical protein